MKNVMDLHTHTMASGHAYSTIIENATEAKKNGIKVLGMTDHGPNMPGGPHIFHFGNLKAVPRYINDVLILKGCEANIINFDGELDLPELFQKRVDIIIASLHDVCINPSNMENNTNAIIKAMDNPLVDILGHIGNPAFPINEEAVVKKAKEKNIIIEFNNGSFTSRAGCEEVCLKVARLCMKYGVKMVLNTDSHISYTIGKINESLKLLEEHGIDKSIFINDDENKILNYLRMKGKLKDLAIE